MVFSQSKLLPAVMVADLPEILAFVEDACERAQVDSDLVFDMQLAVEEACSNVIEHAYQGRGGELLIRFEVHNGDVVITLYDRGRMFNPDAIVRPNTSLPLRKRPIGGLGLHLIYQLMDDVHFSFEPDGNRLVMVKRDAITGNVAAIPPEEADG